MHIIFAACWGLFLRIIPSIVGRTLLAAGIGFAMFTGFQASADAVYAQLQSQLQGMPADIVQLMAFLWVDKAIGALFSGFTAACAIKSVSGLGFKRTFWI